MRSAVVAVARRGAPPGGTPVELARALARGQGDCTLVWASPGEAYRDAQPTVAPLDVVYVNLLESPVERSPDHRLLRLSEQLSPILRRFDVVYGFETGHPAMSVLRERRLGSAPLPYVVTLAGDRPCTSPRREARASVEAAGASRMFGERYQVRHSDRLMLLGALSPEGLEARGYALPGRVHSLPRDLETDEFRELISQVEASARMAARTPSSMSATTTTPSATVCVAHRNCAEFLPEALASLARQSTDDFGVVAVDDGSTDARSRAVFDRMEEVYGPRNWRFLRQPHRGPGAARNFAARHADAEYLLFLDADDLGTPDLRGTHGRGGAIRR